jgi:hypothetical protein
MHVALAVRLRKPFLAAEDAVQGQDGDFVFLGLPLAEFLNVVLEPAGGRRVLPDDMEHLQTCFRHFKFSRMAAGAQTPMLTAMVDAREELANNN